MQEVEFVSELYILLLIGVTEKSQLVINRIYSDYDTHFQERDVIEKRLNWLLETLNELYDDELVNTNLSSRIMLYALVAALYDIAYGLGNSLTGVKPKNRLAGLKLKLINLSNRLNNREKLPESVQDALISRPGSKSNRATLTGFVKNAIDRP